MSAPVFTKYYLAAQACSTALNNYRWLARTTPLALPALRVVAANQIDFEHIDGRHLEPGDLPLFAAHLGDAHAAAWAADLYRARLDQTHGQGGPHLIPDFVSPRAAAVDLAVLTRLSRGPGAFYKDANLRNTLITADGTLVTLDFDSLTLAPFAYDLAKCVVSLAMTYGPLPAELMRLALAWYNAAAARHERALGATAWSEFLVMADLHGRLTAPYIGRHGYIHPWQPAPSTEDDR